MLLAIGLLTLSPSALANIQEPLHEKCAERLSEENAPEELYALCVELCPYICQEVALVYRVVDDAKATSNDAVEEVQATKDAWVGWVWTAYDEVRGPIFSPFCFTPPPTPNTPSKMCL